jgi:hypothetical protein
MAPPESAVEERMNEIPSTSGAAKPKRLCCLLSTVSPDRGLVVALRQNLTEVLPEIEFTLEARADVDAIWLCGFEPGRLRLVRALRERHPDAVLVVTGRGPVEAWEEEVAQAGADFAFSWPVTYEVLSTVLRGGLPSRSLKRGRRSLSGG